MHMNTITFTYKQFALLLFIFVDMLLLFCVALYQYDLNHNIGAQTYANLKKHDQTISKQNVDLRAANGVLTAKLTAAEANNTLFCGELAKAKVVEPLCTAN